MTQHLWQIKNEGDLIMKQAKKFMAAIVGFYTAKDLINVKTELFFD